MKIQNVSKKFYNYPLAKPSFKSAMPIETLKLANIGQAKNGFIGKLKTLNASGEETFLNVYKYASFLKEIYFLKDNAENVIGEIELRIKKFLDYDKASFKADPSHVYVETLRNYSDPKTPFYRQGLKEHKRVGTRLLQIAFQRSKEEGCNGNIELKSRIESSDFYYAIGFKKASLGWGSDPYNLYLPPEAKEPFSKRYGGL